MNDRHLFLPILSDIREPELAGDPIEAETPRIAKAVSPNLRSRIRPAPEWVIGRNGVGPVAFRAVHVDLKKPFALKRDTVFVVDERGGHDSPRVQLSNFRFYQDRATGDVVIFLTRYGEQSEKDWMLADYYRYRVEMP
jgi:hypothetical protein